jgi:hypothetical protein
MDDVVIDLDQWRRARRLLPILVDRHGVAFFLDSHVGFPHPPVFCAKRMARAVDVAASWIERRSGRIVDACGRETLMLHLRRVLEARVHAAPQSSRH